MFATLDPTSRRLRLPHEQEVIINDTVGFIRDLPPDLINAFRATLEEISESNLLLLLVDAANPRWLQQLESVERILSELHYNRIPRLVVFNKADLIGKDELASIMRQASLSGERECVAISALKPESLRPLLERAGQMLARDLVVQPDYSRSEGEEAESRAEYAAHN